MGVEKFSLDWEGEIYDCEWIDDIAFENLNKVLGVHGFIFDENNNVCVLKFSSKEHWSPVGGGVENEDESYEATLIREIKEEADLEVKDIKRLGGIKIIPRNNPEGKHHQVRYVARVKQINKQTIDPDAKEIPKRLFVKPEQFHKYTGWGENDKLQIERALKRLKE
ncbi:MAG: NUDIX hydrolase [Candidatus Nanoarchaeia archaeon]